MQLKRILTINQSVLNAGLGKELRVGGMSPSIWGSSLWRKDEADTDSHCQLPLSYNADICDGSVGKKTGY